MFNVKNLESQYIYGNKLNQQIIKTDIKNILPLKFYLISNTEENCLWEKLIQRYHYLGYYKIVGKRLKYLIFSHNHILLSAIAWKSAAYKLIDRDLYIGWDPDSREKNIDHIVSNTRFIIFPWVEVFNLASAILGKSIQYLRTDWKIKYGTDVYLAETYIDPERYTGQCYKAANWQKVGLTKGYSRVKGGYKYHGKKKEVFIYEIDRNFRKLLDIKKPWYPKYHPQYIKEKHKEECNMLFTDLKFNPSIISLKDIKETLKTVKTHLVEYYKNFSSCFNNVKQVMHGETYLHGLLSSIERKNIEKIALELKGPSYVRGLQKFMKDSPWDDVLMHDKYVELLLEYFNSGDIKMITFDSTEIQKKGNHSVGTARQYSGRLGKVENCQSGVFMGIVSGNGYGLIDNELYLPEKWFSDDYKQKRIDCCIPEDTVFKTKLDISIELLEKYAVENKGNKFNASWLGADSTFGTSREWCDDVEELGYKYLVSIKKDHCFFSLEDRKKIISEENDENNKSSKEKFKPQKISNMLKDVKWEFRTISDGSKGPISAYFCAIRLFESLDNKPLKEVWVIGRKDKDGKIQYYKSNAPSDFDKEELYKITAYRWSIEQSFKDGKEHLGMADYESRSYIGWHRHMLFVRIAMFFCMFLRNKLKKKFLQTHCHK